MREIQRILVGLALDPALQHLTTGSRLAADEAVWLARHCGASLRFLHSSWHDEYYDPLTRSVAIATRGPTPQGEQALQAAVEGALGRGLRAELSITEERPLFAILRAVQHDGADLVAVGKRDEAPSDGRRLGSLASKLLRKCPSPVWVVKPDMNPVKTAVLSATDLTPVGDKATRYGAFLAQKLECEFHVVHAYQVPMSVQMEVGRCSDEEHSEHLRKLREDAEAAVRRSLEGTGMEREARLHVGCTSPSRALDEAVERIEPDILVMGTISRHGIAGLLVGNTAERLLPRVDCSILTVKPDGFVSPVDLP